MSRTFSRIAFSAKIPCQQTSFEKLFENPKFVKRLFQSRLTLLLPIPLANKKTRISWLFTSDFKGTVASPKLETRKELKVSQRTFEAFWKIETHKILVFCWLLLWFVQLCSTFLLILCMYICRASGKLFWISNWPTYAQKFSLPRMKRRGKNEQSHLPSLLPLFLFVLHWIDIENVGIEIFIPKNFSDVSFSITSLEIQMSPRETANDRKTTTWRRREREPKICMPPNETS